MDFDTTRRSLATAADISDVIGIAYGAFAGTLPVLRAMQEPSSDHFSAAVMAAALAANGRDALAFAPSLVIGDDRRQARGVQEPGSESARDIASLYQLLAARLDQTSESAAQDDDRVACRHAAQCAHEIAALLGGGS